LRHPESEHEADALTLWGGAGAVRLLAAPVTSHASALLLERCDPGTPLKYVLPEPEQDEVIDSLLRRLHAMPVHGAFRSLRTMCEQWARDLETRLTHRPGDYDRALVQAALDILRTYDASVPQSALLCTDLHAEHVLAAQREPWLV